MLRPKVCPNCGGPIDLATYRCTYCDTQFYRDGEEDLVEYGYDNNFNPLLTDGDYATVSVRTELSEFELKKFESDVEYRNQIAKQLAAQLAPVLIKYLYINIFDSFEPHNMEVTKYLQAYLKVKRYSAPRDKDILKKFMG